jgi:hypothetical protein
LIGWAFLRKGESARDADGHFFERLDHFVQRGAFAADAVDVMARSLIEPANTFARFRHILPPLLGAEPFGSRIRCRRSANATAS